MGAPISSMRTSSLFPSQAIVLGPTVNSSAVRRMNDRPRSVMVQRFPPAPYSATLSEQ